MRDRGFGWDLPPGVRLSDIPGNRPEDEAEEAFWEAFSEKLDIKSIETSTGSTSETVISIDDLWDSPSFVRVIQIARDLGYNRGFNEGKAETDMARSVEEAEPKRDEAYWQRVNMAAAHAEGLHDNIPREFCEECQESGRLRS